MCDAEFKTFGSIVVGGGHYDTMDIEFSWLQPIHSVEKNPLDVAMRIKYVVLFFRGNCSSYL